TRLCQRSYYILDQLARVPGSTPQERRTIHYHFDRITQWRLVSNGLKNKITRGWATRGARPSAPHDQRTAPTCIFGAICPQEGNAAGLILPWCNPEIMALFLAELVAQSRAVRAGWHMSAKLV